MEPFVICNALDSWRCFNWSLEDWVSKLGSTELVARFGGLEHNCGSILWESMCPTKTTTMAEFVQWSRGDECNDRLPSKSSHFGYMDYKYMIDVFDDIGDDALDWNIFDVDKGVADSTMWVGTAGAYTPCHYDSYGFNLHAQVKGHKSESEALATIMKIYFCGSMRGGRSDTDTKIYATIVDHLKQYGQVLTEHVADDAKDQRFKDSSGKLVDKQIFEADMRWLNESDVVVAEVTRLSLGVGFELGVAWNTNKPTLCIHRPKETDKSLSAMITGAVSDKFKVAHYETFEQIQPVIDQFINNHK